MTPVAASTSDSSTGPQSSSSNDSHTSSTISPSSSEPTATSATSNTNLLSSAPSNATCSTSVRSKRKKESKLFVEPVQAMNCPYPDATCEFVLEPRRGNISSFVWKYFHTIAEVRNDDKEGLLGKKILGDNWKKRAMTCCNCCGSTLPARGKNGLYTGNAMQRHLAIHSLTDDIGPHTDLSDDEKGADGKKKRNYAQGKLSFNGGKNDRKKLKTLKEIKQEQMEAAAFWVASTNQPLNAVANESFKTMINAYAPTATLPTKDKIKDEIIRLDSYIRKKVIQKMKGCVVNLTIDHWTSKQNFNYSGMTAHWLDQNWVLHSLPLGLFLHEGKSQATDIIDEFFQKTAKQISEDATIFAVTTDTDATMNLFGQLLESKQIMHLYCTDHLIHLTCKKAYSKDSYGDVDVSIVKKVTNIVSHFNSSSQALEKLKDIQANNIYREYTTVPVGVLTDVVTRWWATYRMCHRILYLKTALTHLPFDALPEDKRLSQDDWKNLQMIVGVLKPFRDVQEFLEGEKYATASWVLPSVFICRVALQNGCEKEGEVGELCRVMKNDFDARWGDDNKQVFTGEIIRGSRQRQKGIHPAFVLATFLHPQLKLLNQTGMNDASRTAFKTFVLNEMVNCIGQDPVDEEQQEQTVNDGTAADAAQRYRTNSMFAGILAANETGQGQHSVLINNEVQNTTVEEKCIQELKRYKLYNPPSTKLDLWKWWMDHETEFPSLAILAKKYLSIQATSAASERIFSKAGNIISQKRTKLSPSIAGQLLYVSSNYKWFLENFDPSFEKEDTNQF